MSQGRGQRDPYWNTGPPSYQNGYVQNGFVPPHMRERMPNQPHPAPSHLRSQGPITLLAYTRHSMPPEHQKQPYLFLQLPSNEQKQKTKPWKSALSTYASKSFAERNR